MSNLIYVASPYSDSNPVVVEQRMSRFAEIMARLIEAEMHPVSPLLNHYLDGKTDISFPLTWDFWENYSKILLAKCTNMVVVASHGWELSSGVTGEIELANELSIPVAFIYTDSDINTFIKLNK